MNNRWYNNLKAGDKVFVSTGSKNWHEDTIVRVTPKGYLRVGENLFKDGVCSGGSGWYVYRYTLVEYSPENILVFHQRKTISDAFTVMRETKRLTYSQAVKILEILKEVKNEIRN